jgi:hypothetical protein
MELPLMLSSSTWGSASAMTYAFRSAVRAFTALFCELVHSRRNAIQTPNPVFAENEAWPCRRAVSYICFAPATYGESSDMPSPHDFHLSSFCQGSDVGRTRDLMGVRITGRLSTLSSSRPVTSRCTDADVHHTNSWLTHRAHQKDL